MILNSGTVNTFDEETLIFEAGEEVEFIAYIKKGSVTRDNGIETVFNAGAFICQDDMYEGFYSGDYYAEAGSEIIPIKASNPIDLLYFLNSDRTLHGTITYPVCCLCGSLYNMYNTLYSVIENFYIKLKEAYRQYLSICNDAGITPDSYNMPNDVKIYNLSKQPFGKNLTILKNLMTDENKEKELFASSGDKYLKLQIDIINRTYIAYDDMMLYLKELIALFASSREDCLFLLVAKSAEKLDGSSLSKVSDLLSDMKNTIVSIDSTVKDKLNYTLDIDYNRVSFYFLMLKNTMASASDANSDSAKDTKTEENGNTSLEYVNFDRTGLLLQLCNFAGYPEEEYHKLDKLIIDFMAMEDKFSKENGARDYRRVLNQTYYELYTAVFFKYAESDRSNLLARLFLDYGLLDERLVTASQIDELINIAPLTQHNDYGIYRMSDWLLRIYDNKEIPSKNEFDQEYTDHVRELKKNEAMTIAQERKLLEDNRLKAKFEIDNMLRYNSRLINGNLLTFYPMLYSDSFEKTIEAMVLTSESIISAVNKWRDIDYSIFYRELMYTSPAHRIDKEVIQKEIFPIFVLFPVVGINGIMWQDISGKRSNSSGRFFLPALYNGVLEETMLSLMGKFRWELCKTMMGVSWNNVQVPSLTSEFNDYIQFYRKNKELSLEKKEAVKAQLAKCHSSIREFFIYDYIIWLKYESNGAIRLNKLSRKILATYCPFAKDMRDKIATQPIFEEAMKRFNINRLKKIKEYQSKINYYHSKTPDLPVEITSTLEYFNL